MRAGLRKTSVVRLALSSRQQEVPLMTQPMQATRASIYSA